MSHIQRNTSSFTLYDLGYVIQIELSLIIWSEAAILFSHIRAALVV